MFPRCPITSLPIGHLERPCYETRLGIHGLWQYFWSHWRQRMIGHGTRLTPRAQKAIISTHGVNPSASSIKRSKRHSSVLQASSLFSPPQSALQVSSSLFYLPCRQHLTVPSESKRRTKTPPLIVIPQRSGSCIVLPALHLTLSRPCFSMT